MSHSSFKSPCLLTYLPTPALLPAFATTKVTNERTSHPQLKIFVYLPLPDTAALLHEKSTSWASHARSVTQSRYMISGISICSLQTNQGIMDRTCSARHCGRPSNNSEHNAWWPGRHQSSGDIHEYGVNPCTSTRAIDTPRWVHADNSGRQRRKAGERKDGRGEERGNEREASSVTYASPGV